MANGICIWFTGLSGAGKSTLAYKLSKKIKNSKILDGDEVREEINWDLGFSREDRLTNIRRIAYVAKCICDVDGIAIVATISPYRESRVKAKQVIGVHRFMEVHLCTPLETCEKRDVKGLYAQAREGKIKGFTGIDDPYEPPRSPDIILDTSKMTISEAADDILELVGKWCPDHLIE